MKGLVILDPERIRKILRRRRRARADRKDEVWNGLYFMAPDADNEHCRVATELGFAFHRAITVEQVILQGGGNITDRDDDWKKNYRCPDLLVVLPGNPAEDRGTHWYGGPDFVVEIISPNDRSRKKFAFYAKVGVREVLLIDRYPWALELYRRDGDKFALVGKSDATNPAVLTSTVLPLTLRLLPGDPRPRIEVTRTSDGAVWLA
jgi:Uma2 family endonuclease